MTHAYSEPVSRLLKLGRPAQAWQDYLALGLTEADIPELIRLVQHQELRWLEPPTGWPAEEDLPEWYAQIHGWRALAQLEAESAIPALLGILHWIDDDDDDWLSADVEDIFGMLGKPAMEPLVAYLAEEQNPMYARAAASSALARIAINFPEVRARCIQGIVAALEKYETNYESLNGFLIGDLVDLKAVEEIELIKRAFEADAVDEMIVGDIEDVQIELGLLETRLTPERPWRFAPMLSDIDEHITTDQHTTSKQKKEKNKRKQEKKSRKKNRKRK